MGQSASEAGPTRSAQRGVGDAGSLRYVASVLERVELSHGGWVALHRGWLSEREAGLALRALIEHAGWEQRHIVLFGKPILQPRLITWVGELPYRYSGQALEPRAWPRVLEPMMGALWARVAEQAGSEFNHVLVNRYRDGRDSMGYHADAEPELGPNPLVACLSLGRTRRFKLRPARSPGAPPLTFNLDAGSLLVMGGTCQHHYRHAIVREAAPVGERVSLTFRRLLRAP